MVSSEVVVSEENVQVLPVPEHTASDEEDTKKGTSDPMVAPMVKSSVSLRCISHKIFISRKTTPAFELPPPSPACVGMFLWI